LTASPPTILESLEGGKVLVKNSNMAGIVVTVRIVEIEFIED